MFDLRQRLFVMIGIGSGLLIAVILLILFLNRGEEGGENASPESGKNGQEIVNEGLSNENGGGGSGSNTLPTVLFTEASEETAVAALAKDFVERFGTYSNQNDNQHLDAVFPFVTPKMKEWLETQKITQGGSYTGKSTTVVVSSVTKLEGGSAEVDVSVQETLANSAGSAAPSYKKGQVELVKQGETWKVDGLFWEK